MLWSNKEVSEMPKVRNILPKKETESGRGHAMRPFTHSMEEFFGSHFPRRWMEGFFEPYEWKRPFWGEFGESFEVWPKIDILDKEDSLVVRAEMPGVKKEDLDVTIAGDRLTLEAKREYKEEEKKDDYFRSEMAYGRLHRVVPLPVEVKGDEAKAEMKDGVVEVILPKVEKVTPHTVKVA
jgi:HSP20 family protein